MSDEKQKKSRWRNPFHSHNDKATPSPLTPPDSNQGSERGFNTDPSFIESDAPQARNNNDRKSKAVTTTTTTTTTTTVTTSDGDTTTEVRQDGNDDDNRRSWATQSEISARTGEAAVVNGGRRLSRGAHNESNNEYGDTHSRSPQPHGNQHDQPPIPPKSTWRYSNPNPEEASSPTSPLRGSSSQSNNYSYPNSPSKPTGGTIEGLKAAAVGIHGAGETFRGTLNSAVDRHFHQSAEAVAAHDRVAAAGKAEIESGLSGARAGAGAGAGASQVRDKEERREWNREHQLPGSTKLKGILRKTPPNTNF